MVGRLLLLFVLLSAALQAVYAAASLEARVDRTTIGQGETLVLELIQRDDDGRPDLSPLLADFEVLSSSRNNQITIVNGTIDSYTSWRITLSPLRSGRLLIPAISSGSAHSQPVSIVVNSTPSASSGSGTKDFFIEVEVDNRNPYVQAQVLYTVRIFYARDFYDGALSDPGSQDFVHKRLGEDTRFKVDRNGIRYTVIQRKYALFAQKSGTITVPAVVLDANIAAKSSTMGAFGGLLSRRQPVRLRSKKIVLDVRPAAESFAGAWWLPSKSLVATESWSEPTETLRVGNPITRTISIQAQGVRRGQLAQLSMPKIAGLKIYSDQPELGEQSSVDGLLGRHTERWAIIPSRAGEFAVPELRIAWWDVEADRQRFTVLPGRTIVVLAAMENEQTGSVKTPPPPKVEDSTSGQTVGGDQSTGETAVVGDGSSYWPWLVMCLLLAWAATTFFLLHKLSNKRARVKSREPARPKSGVALVQLKSACSSGDLLTIKRAALQWSAAVWPDDPPLSLVELASRSDDRGLSKMLAAIDAALYSGNQAFKTSHLETLVAHLDRLQKKLSVQRQASESPLPVF